MVCQEKRHSRGGWLFALATVVLLVAGCKDAPGSAPSGAAVAKTPLTPGAAEPPEGSERAEPTPSTPARTTGDDPGSNVGNSFDQTPVGSIPADFTSEFGEWHVAKDGGRIVLSQVAKGSAFNVITGAMAKAADVNLTVSLRAVAGKIDQGGGLIWRASSGRNYYVARYNPLEDNYRVYKVVDGRRSELGSADLSVDHAAWHTMRVTMRGDHIECYLDGKKYLDVRDATFASAGRIGLWTKADAQTNFDDFTAETL